MATLADDLALTPNVDANEVENEMKSGGIPTEGYHHAILDGFREIKADSGTHGRELTFLIIAGPSRGLKVKDAIWSPAGHDAVKDERSRNRIRLLAHRLGLLTKVMNPDGKTATYKPVPGKNEFSDAFGAECIIKVKHKEREYQDDKGATRKITDANLDFEGVFTLDDPRVKDVKRGKAADVPKSPPPPPKDDFGDI